MLKWIGVIVLIVGLLGVVAGNLWHLLAPSVDANIGAGALVVVGWPVVGIGVVLLVVALVLARIHSS